MNQRFLRAIAVGTVGAGLLIGSNELARASTLHPSVASSRPADCPGARRKAATTTRTTPRVFRPRTYREGDRTVLPVTFPDGSTAEVVYAPELALESALIVPNWSATVRVGDDGASSDFLVRYGSLQTAAAPYATPTSTERGANGTTVCVYSVDETLGPAYLVYRFGRWIVEVHSADEMAPKVRRAWAAGLTGTVSPDGFLVLGSTGAVEFTSRGQPHGPQLDFHQGGSGVTLHLGQCGPGTQIQDTSGLPTSGSRCIPGTGVFVTAGAYNGRPADEVSLGLEVRNVVLAPR